MHFEFIRRHNNELYILCQEAEKKVKTRPVQAAIEIRKALEALAENIIRRNRIAECEGKPLSYKLGAIRRAAQIRNLSKGFIDKLYEIKDIGNEGAHDKVNTAAVLRQIDLLHQVLWVYYDQNPNQRKYDEDLLPIENYEILESIPVHGDEVCSHKYRAMQVDHILNEKKHVIIKEYKRFYADENLQEFNKREYRILAGRWDQTPLPLNIVRYVAIPSDKESNYLYLAFYLPEDATILDEVDLTRLTLNEKFDVLKAIANGIFELHSMKPPIVHRTISPLSIYIVRNGDRYSAKLCNFEYAKFIIEGNISTVYYKLLQVSYGYQAPELKENNPAVKLEDMLPVDIYSFGLIALKISLGEAFEAYKYASFNTNKKKNALYQADWQNLVNKGIPNDIANLIFDCIASEPGKRPDIEQVIKVLNQ